MNDEYLRGEIYLADLGGGKGSEQRGRRPVMIIQNNVGNKYSSTVIVAALTSEIEGKAQLPTHYHIGASNGLFKDSMILLEQIRTIDKSRIIHYIGQAPEKHINGINRALGISVGLNDTVPICLCADCAKGIHISGAFFIKKVSHVKKNNKCAFCRKKKTFIYNISLNTNRST